MNDSGDRRYMAGPLAREAKVMDELKELVKQLQREFRDLRNKPNSVNLVRTKIRSRG